MCRCFYELFQKQPPQDIAQKHSGGSSQESMDRLEKLMEQQAADQQAVLEEISRNIKELSKGAQKGKFGLFK